MERTKEMENNEIITSFDSNILSSCNINFLFGAGVNGKLFPQMNQFEKTLNFFKKHNIVSKSVEEGMNELKDDSLVRQARQVFCDELKEFNNSIDKTNVSFTNIINLFTVVDSLIANSENRQRIMKQVNIYTLNYDSIIEDVFKEKHFIYNTISASNVNERGKFLNMVGYDYEYKCYLPTYLIHHIHGEMDCPVLPGAKKYDDMIQEKSFEMLFNMKSRLNRPNSILIVIGYSGNDTHINEFISFAAKNDLTVYWFKYSNKSLIPDSLASLVRIVEGKKKDDKSYKDSTEVCKDMIERLWKQ